MLCKAEMARFDKERVDDIRKAVEGWLDGMVTRQQEVSVFWWRISALALSSNLLFRLYRLYRDPAHWRVGTLHGPAQSSDGYEPPDWRPKQRCPTRFSGNCVMRIVHVLLPLARAWCVVRFLPHRNQMMTTSGLISFRCVRALDCLAWCPQGPCSTELLMLILSTLLRVRRPFMEHGTRLQNLGGANAYYVLGNCY